MDPDGLPILWCHLSTARVAQAKQEGRRFFNIDYVNDLCKVIDPKCGIWNSTARTATLLDDVLPTVPRTEDMSAIRPDLINCTHTTLDLVSDYTSHVGPVLGASDE